MLTKDPKSFLLSPGDNMGWMDGWMDVQVLTYCVKLFPKNERMTTAISIYIMGCQNFFNKTGKKSMNVPSK